jgi:hypothetical protein
MKLQTDALRSAKEKWNRSSLAADYAKTARRILTNLELSSPDNRSPDCSSRRVVELVSTVSGARLSDAIRLPVCRETT